MKDDLREQVAALTRRAEAAERERDGNADTLRDVLGWNVDRRCVQCGNTVEVERRVYAIPTCHACLPPPPPLSPAPTGDASGHGADRVVGRVFVDLEARTARYEPADEAQGKPVKFEEMRRYEFDLLELCGRIHGACTGSGDGIPTDVAYEIVDWLEWRLDEDWQVHSYPWPGNPYDDAVRGLCKVALSELREHLRDPSTGTGVDDK